MISVTEIGIAFLPILFFLVFMKLMDSFQLVNVTQVVLAIFAGFITAAVAIFLNGAILRFFEIDIAAFSRFIAPLTEEFLKLIFIIYLIKTSRVGFMVDAAIFGCAVGAGFAIIENIYYLSSVIDGGLLTWFVRGFGTAIMHGGTTAIAAIISKDISDRKNWPWLLASIPALFVAIFLHALFNMFLLPPITSSLLMIFVLPPVFIMIFKRSEENTRKWLGTGLDSDMEMLKILLAGNLSESRIGNYLKSIQNKFAPEIVGDIICYLRVYLELSIKAKGILIMKENGFDLPPDPEVDAQFKELNYLSNHIGKTGKLAIQPLLKINNTDLWQLSMIRKHQKTT